MRVVSTKPYGAGEGARAIGRMTGLASIGAGMVHVAAAADHSAQPLMMAGFEAVAILQVALGCLLLFRLPGNPVLAAGLALMILSIGLWAASRTVGLGFIPGAHAEPIGLRDAITVLFELSACVGIWELLKGARRPLGPGPFGAPSAGLMAAVAVALAAPAILVDGHGHGTGGGAAVHTSGHAGAAGEAAHGAGRDGHGSGHVPDGSHSGAAHDRGTSDHAEHGGGTAAGHGHALAAGPAAGHSGHAALTAAGHPAHASAPMGTHTTGTHTATDAHDGSTGSGHPPAPGGGTTHPPGHQEHSPAAPPAPEPEPTLTEAVAEEIDKLVPGR